MFCADIDWIFDARGKRTASYRRNAASTSVVSARHVVSAAPSSIAWAAPCAMNGSIGWHASPSSVTRPCDQRSSGARSNSAQMNVSSTLSRIRLICGCQPS